MGEMDFVVEGAMIRGFALAAAPAQYRVTGVKTFMVGPDGVVYEKDLGPDTLKTFQGMDTYNPDKTWNPTGDDWPAGPSFSRVSDSYCHAGNHSACAPPAKRRLSAGRPSDT